VKNKNLVEWSDSYSIRIPLIDEQHKKLLAMTNDLYAACNYNTDSGRKQFEQTIHDAVAYTKYHFATEEKIMLLISYPHMKQHKKEHTDFVRTILENVRAFEEGKPLVPNQFVRFLKDWILSHVAITDSKMGDFITGLQMSGKLGGSSMKKKYPDRLQKGNENYSVAKQF
jgi:hemerythrin